MPSSTHICLQLSDGGVHSHQKHLFALLDIVKVCIEAHHMPPHFQPAKKPFTLLCVYSRLASDCSRLAFQAAGVPHVYVHAITDGRDTDPKSAGVLHHIAYTALMLLRMMQSSTCKI